MKKSTTALKLNLTSPNLASIVSAAGVISASIGSVCINQVAFAAIQSGPGAVLTQTGFGGNYANFTLTGPNASLGFIGFLNRAFIKGNSIEFGATTSLLPILLSSIPISSGMVASWVGSANFSLNGSGNWYPPPNSGYIPFRRLDILGNQYGWMRVSVSDIGDGDPYIDRIAVTAWAYNNVANGSIATGEGPSPGPAVPEPSTIAMGGLALLTMGAAGIHRRRKIDARRKAKAKEKE